MPREPREPIPLPIIMFVDKRRLRTTELFAEKLHKATTKTQIKDILFDFYEIVYSEGLGDMDKMHNSVNL